MTEVAFDLVGRDRGGSAVLKKVSRAADDANKKLGGLDKDATAALKKISDATDKTDKKLSDLGKKGSKSLGEKISSGLGDALKKGPLLAAGAGLAIGVALAKGIGAALEKNAAQAKLTAQLGLTGADAKKAGAAAADLYLAGWGENISETADITKAVFQNGLVDIKSSRDAIREVGEQVAVYTELTGEDAVNSTRAVSQMIKTGLARNAEEAFDLLVRGQQLGINKSEDLLDTFNEYGTQFRKLGIDGPAALGLMNQAIQAGARDSDVAADAIKEFSIRAVDGSEASKEGFEGLGLSASKMEDAFAKGGPKATAALDTVLDRLRKVEDPAKRSQIAVQLFGTQAEDLGAALYAMNLDTAVQGLGDVAGATDKVNAALSDTPAAKLELIRRKLEQTFVDAIGKYALPKLEEFADWFNGPGKFLLVSWALEGGSAIINLADKMLGGIEAMLGGLAKFGRLALIAAAGAVAITNPSMAVNMLKNADALGEWADKAKSGIADAREELQGWKSTLDKANTKVKFEADIASLESKLKTAKDKLKDPSLTKERKAQLNADIKKLESQLTTARTKLDANWVTKERKAKLNADIKNLESKLKTAKDKLDDKNLTKERKAQINANIKSLQTQVDNAKKKLKELDDKTVGVNVKFTSLGYTLSLGARTKQMAFAGGGKIHGPGGPTDDKAGLFALSDREWVIRTKAAEKYGDKAMASINAGTATVIPGMATGGKVTLTGLYNRLVERAATQLNPQFGAYGSALAFAKSQAGKPYVWGGVGPGGYDCSGFMSALTNILRGRNPYSRVGATGTFPWAGFTSGSGPFTIGSFKGNPGHMAGTLLGVNVESRGGEGVVVGSRARGAGNGLFGGNQWHLAKLAQGGKAGDAAFDLYDPRGKQYIGTDLIKALKRGVLNRDRGGPIYPGLNLVENGTGRNEWVGSGGKIEIHLHGTEQQLMDQLTRKLDDLRRKGRL